MSAQLPLRYALNAQRDLNEIAVWNERQYGSEHAARYIVFLQNQIEEHCRDATKTHDVPSLTGLRYAIIRRKTAGHGHVAIYRFDDQVIYVLRIFHTAQDWQQRLIDEASPE